MIGLVYICFVLLTSFVVNGEIRDVNPDLLKGGNEICQSITSEPYFQRELAMSTYWTVFYSWNLNLTHVCPDISFKYPKESVINHMYSQMYERLATQPPWSEAVLNMNMEGRDLLLFNDPSGVPGRFIGVPFMEDREFEVAFKGISMPLLEFSMKILDEGKYLVSSSCHVGGGTVLAVRRKSRPTRQRIEAVAASLNFGTRYPTCIKTF